MIRNYPPASDAGSVSRFAAYRKGLVFGLATVIFLATVISISLNSSSSAASIKELLFGGSHKTDSSATVYNPPPIGSRTNKVAAPEKSKLAELNIERHGHTATVLADGRLLIVGGENQNGTVVESEIFDPKTRSFSLAGNSLTARSGHSAIKLSDGRVMVIGGRGSEMKLDSTEIYDPATGSFSYGPSLSQARAGHSTTSLTDGRILIAGGDSIGSAEIFNPESQAFTMTEARLNGARSSHSAILLKNGKVLIAGGLGAEAQSVELAELFDPATMSFVSTGNVMHATRIQPTLRVLPDGKVQVIGGDKEGTMEMFNAEGEYFTAYAHLTENTASPAAVLSAQMRELLLHRAKADGLSGMPGDLFDRGDYSLSDIPQANQVILAGGINKNGVALKSAVVMSTSGASVTTDLTDYVPGQTVIISGAGWQPGETVNMVLHEEPQTHPDLTLSSAASSSGTFTNNSFIVDEHDLGVTFTLTATGQSSGLTATTTFTDGPKVGSVTVGGQSPSPVTKPGNATYTITVNRGTGSGSPGSFNANLSVSTALPAGASASFSPNPVTFTSAQNSRTATLTITTSCSTPNASTNFTVLAERSDNTGDNASGSGTLAVTGTCATPPTIGACPGNLTINAAAGLCSATATFTTPTATGTPTPTVSCSPASGTSFSVGTTNVTCTATNSAGTSSCSFTVTVKDTQAPSLTVPANIVQSNDADTCGAAVSFLTTATDNCGSASVVCSPASGSTFAVGTTTVSCTASDSSADSGDTTKTFTVTVKDTQAPSLTVPADITRNNTANTCGAAVSFSATATDNCGSASVVCSPVSGSTFAVGTTTVTCTASDASADSPNTSNSFTVTVKDVQAPSLTVPANIVQSNDADTCGAAVSFSTTATDNCGSASVVCSPDSGSTFVVGTTTVTCTASDDSADSGDTTKTFTVTVKDTQAPSLTVPADITQGNTANTCGAAVSFSATATDNCGSASVVCVPASGSTFAVGTTTVNCTANDSSADSPSATGSFTVTVNDTQAPSLTVPANIVQSNDVDTCGAAVSFSTTATDNCGSASVVCSPDSGSTFAVGTTTVSCTASDSSADSGDTTKTFTVTVKDTQAPSLTVPADIVQGNTANTCGAAVSFSATATDNCGSASVVCVPASGSTFAVGTRTVTCTANDSSADSPSATGSFTVTVKDTQAPSLSIPSSFSVVDNLAGSCGAAVSFSASAMDNCPGASVVCVPASGSTFAVGTTTVTCTASDASADSSDTSGSFTVTVTNPVPVVTIAGPPSGSLYVIGSTVNFTGSFTDNAGDTHTGVWMFDAASQPATIVESGGSGTANASYTFTTAGVYTVTLKVTDDCTQATTATTVGGLTAMIVVYDPSGGFVTGGGWIMSPAGAYAADMSLTGKANFGFVSKYQRGATIPTGETEFQFKVGNLNFKSTVYEWLVVSGPKAQYKGSGTINGAGDYGFLLTATDGQVNGGGGVDKFRIKIWNKGTGGVVYDNVVGGSDDIDLANPQAIGGGSIVIHK